MRLPILAVPALLVLLSGCSGDDGGGDEEHAHGEVAIEGNAFSPRTVTIHAGQGVVFTNHDATSHTATALDDSWDTGTISQHADEEVEFEEPGTYQYRCKFHPSMTGTVVVD